MASNQFPSPYGIAYCRVSTEEQATHGWSIDEQRQRLSELASNKGLTLLATFQDPGKSGTSLRRPGLRNCLDMIAQRGVGVLLITRLDRLSRTVRDLLRLRQWIHSCGTDLLIADGPTHLRGSGDQTQALMTNIMAITAENEIAVLKSRILPTLVRAARNGNRGGRLSLGYRRQDDGSIVVDPHDAALVRRAAEAVLAGTGISALVRRWATEQVRDAHGELLNRDRLKGALTNPFLLGELIYHAPIAVAADQPVIRIPDHHPRILDTVTFNAVQLRLRSRPTEDQERRLQMRRQHRQGQRRGVGTDVLQLVRPTPRQVHGALPPDITRCGQCGGPMYASLQTVGSRGDRRQVPSYICRYHKDRGQAFCQQPPALTDAIDTLVFARLCRRLERAGALGGSFGAAHTRTTAAEHDVLAAVRAQVDRVTAAATALGDAAPASLRAERARLEADLARHTTVAASRPGQVPTLTGPSAALLRDPQAAWAHMDMGARRDALRHLLARVVIHHKAVTEVLFTAEVPDIATVAAPAPTASDGATA